MVLSVPSVTRRRVVFHAGLLVLALLEWISRSSSVSVFPSRDVAIIAAYVWIGITLLPGDSPRLQPYAVELIGLAFAALMALVFYASHSSVGPHYLITAHPVGVALGAVWTVTALPAIVMTLFTLLQEGGEWLAEWWQLRGTTPEERVLEE